MKTKLMLLTGGLCVLVAITPNTGYARGGHSHSGHSSSHHSSASHPATPHTAAGHHHSTHTAVGTVSGAHGSASHAHAATHSSALHTTVHAPGLHRSTHEAGVHRDKHGRIARSEAAREKFMRMTGHPHGWPGHVIDHIIPLERGGRDDPSNMQWQTTEEAKAKDKIE